MFKYGERNYDRLPLLIKQTLCKHKRVYKELSFGESIVGGASQLTFINKCKRCAKVIK